MAIDEDALVRILVRERGKLTAYIWSIVRDLHATEDVFQEVCLRAVKHRESIESESHLMGWLRRVSRNLSIDLMRRTGRDATTLDESVLELLERQWAETDGSPMQSAVAAVRECFSLLTPNAQRIVKLRYVDGMRSSEVARHLGRKVGAVYKAIVRIHQAMVNCVRSEMQSYEARASDG